jgi:hypothetical protein
MHANWFCRFAGLAACLTLAACHTMRPLTASQIGSGREWDAVWVTRADRSTVIVHAPEVRGDTLSGFVDGAYWEMSLAQVQSMRIRTGSPARTAVLATTSSAAGLALLVYLGNRNYVKSNAQTCSSGNTTGDVADNLPVPCCKVQPNTPC